MYLEELETKLQSLRSKWKSWPKSVYDKRWPEYRADKSRAVWLMIQIEKFKSGLQATPKE